MGKQVTRTPAEIRDAMEAKYKANKVYRWTGYADEPREKPLVVLMEKIAIANSFMPSFLYTIAIGEGLGHLYMDYDWNYGKDGLIILNNKISGFGMLGVDDFGSDYPRIKKYLPKDYNEGDEFEKIVKDRKGEWGRNKVTSAIFKDMESALEGFAAMVQLRRDLFIRDSRALGYPTPNDDQKAFWTYVYYQGEGRANEYLKYNKGLDFTKASNSTMKDVRNKAIDRLATWRYIKEMNIFTR